MKIYLAGNGAMPKTQVKDLYTNFFKYRLISFYEIRPGGFMHRQFKTIINGHIISFISTGNGKKITK